MSAEYKPRRALVETPTLRAEVEALAAKATETVTSCGPSLLGETHREYAAALNAILRRHP